MEGHIESAVIAVLPGSLQGGERNPADALHSGRRESDTSEDARDVKQRQQQQQQQAQAQAKSQAQAQAQAQAGGAQLLAGKALSRSPAASAPLTPPQRSPYSDKPWPVTAVPANQAGKWAYEKYGNKEQKALAAAAAPEGSASPAESDASARPEAAAQGPATDRASSAGLRRPPAAATQAPAEVAPPCPASSRSQTCAMWICAPALHRKPDPGIISGLRDLLIGDWHISAGEHLCLPRGLRNGGYEAPH